LFLTPQVILPSLPSLPSPHVAQDEVEAAGVDDLVELERPFSLRQLEKMEHHASCGFIPHDSLVRRIAAMLVVSPWFERLTLFVILVSSINLALDGPNAEQCDQKPCADAQLECSNLRSYLDGADIAITTYFVLEMALKIVAMGVYFHPMAYLRNSWNVLDTLIVLVSIVSLATASGSVKGLRAFRALRALRPLRAVSRFPGLKLVVNSLLTSLGKVKDVAAVVSLFIFIFAVIGMQNFRGVIAACNDPSVATQADCVGTFTLIGDMCGYLPTQEQEDACRATTGVDFPRIWQSLPRNYDHIGMAALTVYELGTGENWPGIMTNAVDASTVPGEAMVRDANPAAAIYFIAIQAVLGFVLLDFFAGIIVDTYKDLKSNSQGTGLLTTSQRVWVDNMVLMLSVKPRPIRMPPAYPEADEPANTTGAAQAAPSTVGAGAPSRAASASSSPRVGRAWASFRQSMYYITTSKAFEGFIILAIVANVVFLALKHYGMTSDLADVIESANYAFTAVFFIEMAMKLVGWGPGQYFRSAWCRFDFFLVLMSLLSVGFSVSARITGAAMTGAPIATLLRILRVLRLFRLVKSSKGLQRMLRTVIFALPSLSNVMGVLFLIYFIFAVVGMSLFAGTRYGYATTGNLNEDANFDSFSIALITLFRASTGEDYNGLMHDLMVAEPYCKGGGGPDDTCGNSATSPIFWVIFFSLTDFLMIKLLIAIVLDAFLISQDVEERGDAAFKLTEPIVKRFRKAWQKYDPRAGRYIGYRALLHLVQDLDYPLGLASHPRYKPENFEDQKFMRKAAERLVSNLSLVPDGAGRFNFQAVLYALCANASGGNALGAPAGAVAIVSPSGSHGFTLREIRAAILVQAAFRARQAKKLAAERRALGMLVRQSSLDSRTSAENGMGGAGTGTGSDSGTATPLSVSERVGAIVLASSSASPVPSATPRPFTRILSSRLSVGGP
jgi:hypothetical protein